MCSLLRFIAVSRQVTAFAVALINKVNWVCHREVILNLSYSNVNYDIPKCFKFITNIIRGRYLLGHQRGYPFYLELKNESRTNY